MLMHFNIIYLHEKDCQMVMVAIKTDSTHTQVNSIIFTVFKRVDLLCMHLSTAGGGKVTRCHRLH